MSFNFRLFTTLTLFLFLLALRSSAQSYEIINLETLLNSKESVQKSSVHKSKSSENSAGNSLDINKVTTLIFEVTPTVYIQNNKVEHFETEPPILASIEDDSYQLIYSKNDLFEKVEMVKFRYNKKNNISINISEMTGFPNLKYFFIECESSCTEKDLAAIFSNAANIPILYKAIQSE